MAKNNNKSTKENKHFFKDFKAEIKKVIWPTPKQLVNTTVAIVMMVIIVSAIVFILDLAFDATNKYGLTNLQKAVQSAESNNSEENNQSNVTSDENTTVVDGAETENSKSE